MKRLQRNVSKKLRSSSPEMNSKDEEEVEKASEERNQEASSVCGNSVMKADRLSQIGFKIQLEIL